MKKMRIFSILLVAVLFITSCEQFETTPYIYNKYDDVKGNLPTDFTVAFSRGSSLLSFIAADDNATATFDISVKLIGAPSASDITVEIALDPSANVPEGAMAMDNSAVIKAGELSGSFSVTLKAAGMPPAEYVYVPIIIKSVSSGTVDTLGNKMTLILFKNCTVDINRIPGKYSVDDGAGDDPWVADADIIEANGNVGTFYISNIWYSSEDTVRLELHADGSITGEDQFIYNGNAFGAYGRIAFEDINGGALINNCLPIFTFKATPTLPDTGYWWGGEFTFTLTKVGGKFYLVDRKIPAPVKRN